MELFDKAVKITEKYLPRYKGILRDAKIFEFDTDLDKDLSVLPWDKAEEMRLPFETIAIKIDKGIEEPTYIENNLVVLQDIDTIGYQGERKVLIFTFNMKVKKWGSTIDLIIEGTLKNYVYNEEKKGLTGDTTISNVHFIENKKRYSAIENGVNKRKDVPLETILKRNFSRKALAALCYILLLNDMQKFILEKSPIKYLNKKPSKKIPRYHQRPIYTILKPKAIREQLGWQHETNTDRKSPTAGPRRGSWYTFKHPRYKNMLGKKQWRNATWVGKKEEVIGNHLYKVRLDI